MTKDKILFVFLNCITVTVARGQDTSFTFLQRQIDVHKRDSIISLLQRTNETLENSNTILNTALNANSNIFGGLSTYFTLITILLSIIVIAVPLVGYFLVLKPNRKVVKRLKKLETDLPIALENNFENYLKGFERKKSKQLLKSLESLDNLKQVIDFFFFSTFVDFDDDDQNHVVEFLEKNKDLDSTDRLVLNSILKVRPSLISETYYKRILESKDTSDYPSALGYLVYNNLEKNIPFFEMLISASDNGNVLLMDIIELIVKEFIGIPLHGTVKPEGQRVIGETKCKLFLNNKNICEAVNGMPMSKHRIRKGFLDSANIINWNPFIRETLYYQMYLTKYDKK